MSVALSSGVGLYQASQGHTAAFIRLYKPSSAKRGVVFMGGRSTAYSDFFSAGNTYQPYHFTVARTGLPFISISTGTTWGNDAIRTQITNARAYINSAYGATITKVILVGGSMGALNAMSWAIANPTLVQAMALTTPPVNLDYMHDNDVGGYAAEIETAYTDLATYDAAVGTHDPYQNTATLSAIPMKLWYSTDDPYIDPSHVTTFATATGATTVNMGAVGHTLPSAHFQQVADFISAYV